MASDESQAMTNLQKVNWEFIRNEVENLNTIDERLINQHNLNRMIRVIAYVIVNGVDAYPPPPYTKAELVNSYQPIMLNVVKTFEPLSLESTVVDELEIEKAITNLLRELSIQEQLILVGQRLTPASIRNAKAFPPDTQVLMTAAQVTYNDKLTLLTRAWSKHVSKCQTNYWGEIKGSPSELNKQSADLLFNLLNINPTWWNAFGHFKHGEVFEIRDVTGHGARWKLDGFDFIGLVEAVDTRSQNIFRETE